LQQLLGVPELSWLVERIRGRLERGEPVDGTVTLVGATAPQRRAAARLLGHAVGHGSTLSVPLPELAATLRRQRAAPTLHAAVEGLTGPVRNLAAERAAQIQHWEDALTTARASGLARLAWYREWLDEITRDGTVTRLIRQGHRPVLDQAPAVLERLPAGPEPAGMMLRSLAEAATGDAGALGSGPLAGLVLRAIALRERVPEPVGPGAEQALWTLVGIVADDLDSQVLVLNVRALGDRLGHWLSEAADEGEPFRITLRQLVRMPVLPWAIDLYVCASPMLLRAAAEQLGPASPPLVCSEGEPSVACARLLYAAASSGTRVHWHGDFTWPGVRAAATAIRRVRAEPWLMGAADYETALAAGGTTPLAGQIEPTPWDPRLAQLMRASGRAVAEAGMAGQLLADLAARG
jgi:uncharacterized protein (TIGR02679 family)